MTLAVIGVAGERGRRLLLLRIVKVMYFDEPRERLRADAAGAQGRARPSRAPSILLFWLVPAPLVGAAGAAARSLF